MKHKLRTLLVCLPLLVGSLIGAPMRPEEIEELMQRTNQQKIAYTIPDESENGDDTTKKLPGGVLRKNIIRPYAAISSSQYSWCSPPRTSLILIRQAVGNSCR